MMDILEQQNILVTLSGKKNKIRVYYLSWLKNKIFKSETVSKKRVLASRSVHLHQRTVNSKESFTHISAHDGCCQNSEAMC